MAEKRIEYIDDFRDRNLISRLADSIGRSASGEYIFMEVCGGHTAAIHKFGIPSLLPPGIGLISGPGCPVCVTGKDFIDKAVALAEKDFIVAVFGDLLRVPGTSTTLEKVRAGGADVRIVFSGLEAIDFATANRGRKVIFAGIGFETTTPGSAVTVKEARKRGLKNFFLLSSHKVMPPAMDAIIIGGVRLNGFICPGHVASVTGSEAFAFIPEKYGIGCAVSGFEPVDLLLSVRSLVRQVNDNTPFVDIQYKRAVTRGGNTTAQRVMADVFEKCDSWWRGFGVIPGGGLRLRREFEDIDAEKAFQLLTIINEEEGMCICSEILRGRKGPADCPLYDTVCTPDNPVGACMVSNEGACNAFYRYIE